MISATIAYFITDHGFGHASRSAAVMAALERIVPEVRFELFTTSPRWLYEDSLANIFGYHSVQTDVGLVQLSPLDEDLEATCRALQKWLPFEEALIQQLADQVNRLGCRLVMCDISALGIAVARKAGVPSVLVENFTWDWIYAAYGEMFPEMVGYSNDLNEQYDQADMHIQTEPLCNEVEGAIRLAPISRSPRTPPSITRDLLSIPSHAKMVLVSMGGVPDRFRFLEQLPEAIAPFIVIPGCDRPAVSHRKVIQLPAHSRFYHPDLLAAADLLIGKAGYSTVAEAYHAGVPFGPVPPSPGRQSPESHALEQFIERSRTWYPGQSVPKPIRTDDGFRSCLSCLIFAKRSTVKKTVQIRQPASSPISTYEPNSTFGFRLRQGRRWFHRVV